MTKDEGDSASAGDVESPASHNVIVASQQQQDEESTHVVISRHDEHGSSLGGAIFNFTNSIIGAGAIGLGGAFAASGGLASIVALLSFGILTKLSLDMVVVLSVETEGAHNSYEQLAKIASGSFGYVAVVLSKTLYSFGCLVAYLIVIKDNFASALSHLLFGEDSSDWLAQALERNNLVTLFLSIAIIFPLCLLRDMSSLSNLSAVSVVSMIFIVMIVLYLYIDNPGGNTREPSDGSLAENWLEVRPGFVMSLGTFVFTFVSQHTVHLAFESLRPEIRTVENWKKVSFYSILISSIVSLSIGVVVYMTFWEHTQSDLFAMYPPLRAIDISKLLLCVTMILTFPLPFFTCRDMIVLCLIPLGGASSSTVDRSSVENGAGAVESATTEQLQEPLLRDHDSDMPDTTFDAPASNTRQPAWLIPGQERQPKLPYHVAITFILWGTTTVLAIMAPSLGDVLDLVGCATGTVIAFILPALFSFQLKGYSHLAAIVLVVGGLVGFVGTIQSIKKLMIDL